MSTPAVQKLLDYFQTISLAPFNIGVQITAIGLSFLLLSETAHSNLGRWIFKPLASFGFLVAALASIPNNSSTFVASSTAALTSYSTLDDVQNAISTAGGVAGLATAYLQELKHILFNVAPTILPHSMSSSVAGAGTVAHTTYTQAVMGALVLGAIGDVLLIPKCGFLPGLVSFLAGHAAFMVAFTFHGQDETAQQGALGIVVAISTIIIPWLIPKIKSTVMRCAVIMYMFVISGMVITAVGSVNSGRDYIPERILGAFMFFFSDLFVARQHFVHKSALNKWIGLPLYYVAQILLATTLRSEHVLDQ